MKKSTELFENNLQKWVDLAENSAKRLIEVPEYKKEILHKFAMEMYEYGSMASKFSECFYQIARKVLSETFDDLKTDSELHPEDRFRKEVA